MQQIHVVRGVRWTPPAKRGPDPDRPQTEEVTAAAQDTAQDEVSGF